MEDTSFHRPINIDGEDPPISKIADLVAAWRLPLLGVGIGLLAVAYMVLR